MSLSTPLIGKHFYYLLAFPPTDHFTRVLQLNVVECSLNPIQSHSDVPADLGSFWLLFDISIKYATHANPWIETRTFGRLFVVIRSFLSRRKTIVKYPSRIRVWCRSI